MLCEDQEYREGHVIRYGRGMHIISQDIEDLLNYWRNLSTSRIPVQTLPKGGFCTDLIWESQETAPRVQVRWSMLHVYYLRLRW